MKTLNQVVKKSSIILDASQIKEILPHQDPFLFIDSAIISEDKAEGTYTITGEEYFLKGHFKDEPVFPASIMIEAVGQLAVLYLLRAENLDLPSPIDNQKVMFTSCEQSSCHRLCKPGDTLKLEVSLKRVRPPLIKFDCLIRKFDKKVFYTEGLTLAFSFKK